MNSLGNDLLVSLPARRSTPLRELLKRVLVAFLLLAISTAIVWFDRDSYVDNANQDGISLVDAIYYSTVTVTTTGYGDIAPVTQHARLINAVVVTPLRIMFLVLLVGTTLAVLANQGRRILLDSRWRKSMRNHVVVIGFGTKGRSAVNTLRQHDVSLDKVVVIDDSATGVEEANTAGLAAIHGDATRREVLRRAEISKAREVIVTLDRDDSAILVTLTVRQLNPTAHIVVAVREHENGSLLRQSGADAVVTSSDAVGRLLGLSAVSPNIGETMEDLLSSGQGMEVSQRAVTPDEVGSTVEELTSDRVLAVVRNTTLRRYYDPAIGALKAGDQLISVRRSETRRPKRENGAHG